MDATTAVDTHENNAADICQQHEVLERLAETTPQPQKLDSEGDDGVFIYHVDEHSNVISQHEFAQVRLYKNDVR